MYKTDKDFNCVYVQKNGLFNSRKLNISLIFHENNITGSALKISEVSGYSHQAVNFEYRAIENYGECNFENGKALKIETCINLHDTDWHDTFIFPFEPKYLISDILKELDKNIDTYIQKLNKIEEEKKERIKRQQEREERHNAYLAELQNKYNSIYNFHIHESTPVYIFNKSDMSCFVAFIGNNKSINFLYIDVQTNCEIHSMIAYDEIHYYEKAGTVHYTTSINADYTSGQYFGGSFVGSKISTGMTALGGLLFGPMGMAIGAISSYTPAEYIPPTYVPSELTLTSKVNQIDDRSIILNYYSQQHKQFVDIELPQEIYNFLQTFLPDKKYAIVIEKEKQAALEKSDNTLAKDSIVADDTIAQRLQKLKNLFEMNLISENEYKERKKEILAEI